MMEYFTDPRDTKKAAARLNKETVTLQKRLLNPEKGEDMRKRIRIISF